VLDETFAVRVGDPAGTDQCHAHDAVDLLRHKNDPFRDCSAMVLSANLSWMQRTDKFAVEVIDR
jgi:hypothetical protein